MNNLMFSFIAGSVLGAFSFLVFGPDYIIHSMFVSAIFGGCVAAFVPENDEEE